MPLNILYLYTVQIISVYFCLFDHHLDLQELHLFRWCSLLYLYSVLVLWTWIKTTIFTQHYRLTTRDLDKVATNHLKEKKCYRMVLKDIHGIHNSCFNMSNFRPSRDWEEGVMETGAPFSLRA